MAPSDKTNLKQEALAERRVVSVIFQKFNLQRWDLKILKMFMSNKRASIYKPKLIQLQE